MSVMVSSDEVGHDTSMVAMSASRSAPSLMSSVPLLRVKAKGSTRPSRMLAVTS